MTYNKNTLVKKTTVTLAALNYKEFLYILNSPLPQVINENINSLEYYCCWVCPN